jgi:hypothetical protein
MSTWRHVERSWWDCILGDAGERQWPDSHRTIKANEGRSILVVVSFGAVRYQYTYYKFRLREETIQKGNSAMCRIQAPLA